MDLKFHSTVLFVKDIEVSKNFYCNILMQVIDADFGNVITLKNGLSLWQISKKHRLEKDFHPKNNSNRSMEICFEIEHIDQIIELIQLNKIPLHHDLTEESWGQRTIRFYDPDQNLVEVGETLEVFIHRLKNQGLTVHEINKKTGVPVEQIKNLLK